MLVFTTHNYFIFRRQEIWFYKKNTPLKETSYNVYTYLTENIFPNPIVEYSTRIDLTMTMEQLFKNLNQTFRYHIKKAEEEDIQFEINFAPSLAECKKIVSEFKAFANKKNIEFNPRRLFSLQKKGNLVISNVKKNEIKIATHINLVDFPRAVLLHSYDHPNNLPKQIRGYANKYLHWKELEELKKKEFTSYDFGGINKEMLPGITEFKLNFGGEQVTYYNYIRTSGIWNIFVSTIKNLRALNGK